MANTEKKGVVYWLQQIATALGYTPYPDIEVGDITALTNEQLDALNVGDKVVKVTGAAKHLYLVTYKGDGEGQGIVLTYNACGYGEAVAYDRSGTGWVYNSTDVKTYGD